MSLFQRRHFNKIAEIAAYMDLTDWQLNVLIMSLVDTNSNFNANSTSTRGTTGGVTDAEGGALVAATQLQPIEGAG